MNKISKYLDRITDLKEAIRRKVQQGDGFCGITEGLRKELWRLENYPDTFNE